MNDISLNAMMAAVTGLTEQVRQLTITVDTLKSAHNNLANRAMTDLNNMAATIKKLSGIVVQQAQRLDGVSMNSMVIGGPPSQGMRRPQQQTRPQQPQSGPAPMPVSQPAIPTQPAAPATLPDPMTAGWGEEEDAEIE